MVREVAYMSNALANTVWQAYADRTLDAPSSLPTITDAGGLRLAVAAVKREFCVQAVKALIPDEIQGGNLAPLKIAEQRSSNGQAQIGRASCRERVCQYV